MGNHENLRAIKAHGDCYLIYYEYFIENEILPLKNLLKQDEDGDYDFENENDFKDITPYDYRFSQYCFHLR